MNILISSAGRRVSLVKAFQKEIRFFSEDNKVVCCDSNPSLSAACKIADNYFKVPRISEDNFIDFLLDKCLDLNITLIIPTIDTELSILVKNKKRFELAGIDIMISSETIIKEASSKILTKNLFDRFDIAYPKIYSKESPVFPLIVKPEFGSSSKDIFVVNSKEMLSENLLTNNSLFFFEYLNPKNFTEFTVDLYYDKTNYLKCMIPRERIETRGGEVSKGVTRKNILNEIIGKKMNYWEGAIGCITAQFFVSKINSQIYGIEVNPRFGGGFPLSYLAGANFPKWLIKEYFFAEKIEGFYDWEENLLMLRYDDEILSHNYEL
ncbi:MAG: ATP-grasp domain-containing protein [bacterium]